MDSFLRRSKDSLVKESLQRQLVACVKDIQLDHVLSGQFQSSSEVVASFCTVLEAIFIHGIKQTLADKMATAIGDPDSRPEPNFWPALLVFSHREIIDQIGRLNFVSSDVGRCRAWLRIAINESLLSSYLQSMLVQNSALNSFYKRSAFLRDKELLDLFISLLSGIEDYSFNLVCNSSLLNFWTNQPLLMSGVWSPAMKSCPVTCGTDIASSLIDDSTSLDVESLSSVASFYESSPRCSEFDEDTILKQILGDVVTSNEEEKILEESAGCNKSTLCHNKEELDDKIKKHCISNTYENEIPVDQEIQETIRTKLSKSNEIVVNNLSDTDQTEIEIIHNKFPLQSYNSLFECYDKTSNKIPDLQDLLERFQKSRSDCSSIENVLPVDDDKLTFEEIVPEHFDPSEIPEFEMLIQHISRIASEQGLDSQNYTCKTCPKNIGVNFREAKVCGLSGAYYCSECFGSDRTSELWVIPARMIYNWDFRQYSVSHHASNFLSQTQLYPIFDIRVMNNNVYSAIEEMMRLKDIRLQLNYLGDYLKTCRGNALESLQRLLWPRDYMYENLHLYSLADLIQIPSGVLEGALQKAVDVARNHVVSCSFCIQRGFICEVCDDREVIFPFDLGSTHRCDVCGAVYHAKCLLPGQPCRKCSRIQERQLLNTSLITYSS